MVTTGLGILSLRVMEGEPGGAEHEATVVLVAEVPQPNALTPERRTLTIPANDRFTISRVRPPERQS